MGEGRSDQIPEMSFLVLSSKKVGQLVWWRGLEVQASPEKSLGPDLSSHLPSGPGGRPSQPHFPPARPELPLGKGGGKASWFFPGFPSSWNIWPRTSALRFCRAAAGRPRTHLPPPRLPPHLRAAPLGRFPAPGPPPAGPVPTGRVREARAAHLPRAAARRGGSSPQASQRAGHGAQERLSGGCATEQSRGEWPLPARLYPKSPPGAAGSKGGRRPSCLSPEGPACPPGRSPTPALPPHQILRAH